MTKLAVVMDPIDKIKAYKDTSLAILLAAQERGIENYYIEPEKIWLQDGMTWGQMHPVQVKDDNQDWFSLGDPIEQPLPELDLLLIRKDPPFDLHYVHLTYLLEQAQEQGLLVINDPASLRDANEKLFTAWFPQCCPRTLVTSQIDWLKEFVLTEKEVVIKPLDSMGGYSVFRARNTDENLNVILETLTQRNKKLVMAQTFIPQIRKGDKRILLIDGEPIPYALARIPALDDFRGNLAAGATSEGRELTDHDLWICEQVGPVLEEKGLVFVGIDIIGDYLTEINVTSPTCVRELNALYDLDIAGDLIEHIMDEYL